MTNGAEASRRARVVVMLPSAFAATIERIVGAEYVRRDDASRLPYGTDALKQGRPADLVVLPATTRGDRRDRAPLP